MGEEVRINKDYLGGHKVAAKTGISAIIPTYITSPINIQQFKRLVESIARQTVLPGELIITDNSPNLEGIKTFNQLDFKKGQIDVKLIDARAHLGISKNSNCGLAHASQEIVHTIHQDDFLADITTYSQVINAFDKAPNVDWLVISRLQGQHLIFPTDDELIICGYNTLGGPSCIFVRKKTSSYFREDLNYFLDVDLYQRLYDDHGFPILLSTTCVNLNQIGNRVSNMLTFKQKVDELIYLAQTTNHNLLNIRRIDILRRTSMMNVGEVILGARIKLKPGPKSFLEYYSIKFIFRIWTTIRNYPFAKYARKSFQFLFK